MPRLYFHARFQQVVFEVVVGGPEKLSGREVLLHQQASDSPDIGLALIGLALIAVIKTLDLYISESKSYLEISHFVTPITSWPSPSLSMIEKIDC